MRVRSALKDHDEHEETGLIRVLPEWRALHSIHYEYLSSQQNMLEDLVRTGAYQRGMLLNRADFEGRVILDVGAGTGILSLFAAQAGARKVYAVEGTESSEFARKLVSDNGFDDRIEIIRSTLSDLTLPEKVDIVISEPWGFFLFHERMVESFLLARDRYLGPGGTVFPSTGRIWIAPFCDRALHDSRLKAAEFWETRDFYGVNLSGFTRLAKERLFEMPAIGSVSPRSLMATPSATAFDFRTMPLDSLAEIRLGFEFCATRSGSIHGIAGWFDVSFDGSQECVRLTTGPDGPQTHWMQLRFVLQKPLSVRVGQKLDGVLVLKANEKSSYTAHLDASLEGGRSVKQQFELHAHFWWDQDS